jgi:predicted dehydrogenase
MGGKMKTYLLVGTGARGIYMFAKPIVENFKSKAKLVGLFDNNPLRMETAQKILNIKLPSYTNFKKAMDELNPDCVIVCSKDSTHTEYIVQALKRGKDVISEKPLCINKEQCRQIINAEKKSKGKVAVAHNYRYGPAMMTIKKLISDGKLGDILSVDFHEKLYRVHGAAYFRRWHRRKENSGGLLVHKACHCFDLINWFVGAKPKEVFATGDIVFYGKNGKFRGKRCYGCMHSKKCDFYFNLLSSEKSKQLYFDAEKSDGYIRDACVFDKEINIEDTANVLYKYKNGTFANFSLVAYCGCEGIDIVIEGTKGRLEYNLTSDTQWLAGQKSIIHGLNKQIGKRLLFYPFRGKFTEVKIKESKGAHGGGDPRIQRDLFFTDWPKMGAKGPLASVEQAVDAILIGDAANKSIKTGKVIKI